MAKKIIREPIDVAWVTSFAADMYKASAAGLIDSFKRVACCGKLWVMHEGVLHLPESSNVVCRDISHDAYLLNWLEKNSQHIPKHLGGNAGECACKGGPYLPHDKRHAMPCIGQWFNRNASRWYRKIVAMRAALLELGWMCFSDVDVAASVIPSSRNRVLIWVDSDCEFLSRMSETAVLRMFGDTAHTFYHQAGRKVLEAGVMGYHIDRGAWKVIDHIHSIYQGGQFHKLDRWDDSYIIQKVLRKLPKQCTIDLAERVGPNSGVIPYGRLKNYITHKKGSHSRVHKVMI